VLYCLLAISAVAVWVVGLAKSVEVGIQRTVSGAELGEGCACFSTTEVAVVLLPDFAPPCRRDVNDVALAGFVLIIMGGLICL